MKKNYECVIIGIGRVGLPLGLSMASKGISVVGLDLNEELIVNVNNKIFPFKEEAAHQRDFFQCWRRATESTFNP
jgi:UDP-N-acetyl-D-mannosaminuronate dehydrogenase